jgi:hypothetical protein
MLTSAGFNRRMRKTACPVVWKGCGVKLPSAPSNLEGAALGKRSHINTYICIFRIVFIKG